MSRTSQHQQTQGHRSGKQGKKTKKSYIAKRKSLKRRLSQKLNIEVEWYGGTLYVKSTMVPVPNVPSIPKPGTSARGREAAFPPHSTESSPMPHRYPGNFKW